MHRELRIGLVIFAIFQCYFSGDVNAKNCSEAKLPEKRDLRGLREKRCPFGNSGESCTLRCEDGLFVEGSMGETEQKIWCRKTKKGVTKWIFGKAVSCIGAQIHHNTTGSSTDSETSSTNIAATTTSTPTACQSSALLGFLNTDASSCNNVQAGTECELSCKSGYKVGNDKFQTITCKQSGEWDLRSTKNCEEIKCKSPAKSYLDTNNWEVVPGEKCKTSNMSLGSTCNIRCKTNYIVPATPSSRGFEVHCSDGDSGASWKGYKGKECKAITCPTLNIPDPDDRRDKKPTLYPSSCSNKAGTTCSLGCGERYEFQNEKTRKSITCTQNGDAPTASWIPEISTIGSCKAITCPSFPYNDGKSSTSKCANSPLRSTCKIECAADYKFDGTKNYVTCTKTAANAGIWSNNDGKCVPKTCPSLSFNDGESTKYICSNMVIGSTCTLSCAKNFKFRGSSNSLTCAQYVTSEKNGRWSTIGDGKCVPITCPALIIPDLENRRDKKPTLSPSRCSNNAGTTCSLKCGERYEFENKETSKSITCTQNGDAPTASWIPEISTIGSCKAKILKNRNCNYWISDVTADGRDDAETQCETKVGSGYVVAMPKLKQQRDFLKKQMDSRTYYLINVGKKKKDDSFSWGDGEKYDKYIGADRNCVKLYKGRTASSWSSCNAKYICEKWQDDGYTENPCSASPCTNGECIIYGCSYKCKCPVRFYGRHCEEGPISLRFSPIYPVPKDSSVTVNYTAKTNEVGEADLEIFVNGKSVQILPLKAKQSGIGSILSGQHIINNVERNTYVSGKATLRTSPTTTQVMNCTKISVRGMKKQIFADNDICDENKLTVNWTKLENSPPDLPYTIKVGSTERDIMTSGPYDITKLDRKSKYTVKVIPKIESCPDKDNFFEEYEREAETSIGPPRPTKSVTLSLKPEGCEIKWNAQKRTDISGYTIKREELARTSLTPRFNEPQDTTEEKLNLTYKYSFSTNPNSKYRVQVGTNPPAICSGKVPVAWSNETIGCATKASAPKEVSTPSIDDNQEPYTMTINLSPVNERNGIVSCYIVVVQKQFKDGNETKIVKDIDMIKQSNDTIEDGDSFVAFAMKRFNEAQKIVLGEGGTTCCDMNGKIDDCSTKNTNRSKRAVEKDTVVRGNNQELDIDSKYRFYILVSTPDEDGGYPSVGTSEPSAPWSVKKEPTGDDDGQGGVPYEIILPIVILLIISVLLIAGFLYKRKQSKKKPNSDEILMRRNIRANRADEHIDVEVNLERQNPDEIVSRMLRQYSFQLSNLFQMMNEKRADEDLLFLEEFKGDVPTAIKACNLTTDISKLPVNQAKNRYKNIVPYDNTRVLLNKLPGDEFSDYVNAAFIDGYNFPNKFIATQGPKPNTIDDFWRMIWEHECCVIAVLTRLTEKKKVKCAQYWSETDNKSSKYGEITVKLRETSSCGDYVRRQFELTKNNMTREVAQFQFIAWPDHGIPVTTSSLFRFHKAVVFSQPHTAGPIVVHCSAGVGRTGTFIALDILSEQIAESEEFNICEIVGKMRTRRPEMVQTLDQYIYIHKLLLELYQFGETDVDVSGFNAAYKNLQRSNGQASEIDHEFEMLDYFLPLDTDQDTGCKPENKHLNRDQAVIPYDHNAVFIQMNPTDKCVPYYNASSISSYHTTDTFIAAQTPTSDSVEAFWRTIMDNKVSMIVTLCAKNEDADFCFWPKKGVEKKYGPMSVKTIEEKSNMGCIERKFSISLKDKKMNSSQIYYGQWAENANPANSGTLLEIIASVERHHQTLSNSENKITLVHCSDGSGRTGAFCAISNLIERLKNENRVDVFRTVKDLRDQRMMMVRTVGQYEFCYQAVSEFLQSFDLYGNFQ